MEGQIQTNIGIKARDWSKGLNAFDLKLLALFTMVLDHVGALLIPFIQGYVTDNNTFIMLEGIMVLLRSIGRISFPIFAFLLVTGFVHTSSRKNYLIRLFVFAIISEPFFDYAVFGTWFDFSLQNVFFTLSLGLITIWGYDFLTTEKKANIVSSFFLLTTSLLAVNLRTDYDFYGIVLIFLMYIFYDNKKYLAITFILFNFILYGGGLFNFSLISAYIHDTYGYIAIGKMEVVLQVLVYLQFIMQLFCIGALWSIFKYNGEKGSSRLNKYVFYAFYSVHFVILILIMELLKLIL